jgi:hypothetical protein
LSVHTAQELGVCHDPLRSLAVGSASRSERYRQGKADRQPANPQGSREFYQWKRFVAGQVGDANAAAGSKRAATPAAWPACPRPLCASQPRTEARSAAASTQPRPVAAGVPPPRFPGLEHRRARLEPWARIEGCAGRPLCLEQTPRRRPGSRIGPSGPLAQQQRPGAAGRWRPLVAGGWRDRGRAGARHQAPGPLPAHGRRRRPGLVGRSVVVHPNSTGRLLQQHLSDAGANSHHRVVAAPEGVVSRLSPGSLVRPGRSPLGPSRSAARPAPP